VTQATLTGWSAIGAASEHNEGVIPEPTQPQLEVAARTFALLSTPARLHLVALAATGEYDVSTLAQLAGISIATTSQHLSKLRLAGIISSHRDGKRLFYVCDDPHVLTMVHQIFEHIAPDGALAPDPPMPTLPVVTRPPSRRDAQPVERP
jgi:DNA-binding transcriptional ArsR family regulator